MSYFVEHAVCIKVFDDGVTFALQVAPEDGFIIKINLDGQIIYSEAMQIASKDIEVMLASIEVVPNEVDLQF